jgi:soluble lytic murein transglycosylase-like protein
MRIVLPALILASSALVCAFALLSNYCFIDLLTLCSLRFAKPDVAITLPQAVFKGSTQRLVADLMKKLDAMKPVDARALIRAAAEKNQVPAALVKSIVAAESNFHCEAVSPTGAIGLMQLMPETAHEYGVDPTIPEQNVDAGTRYLNFLMHKYRKSPNPLSRVIAAYNAGPSAVDHYHGIPPFRETRGYVARVMSYMRQYRKERG